MARYTGFFVVAVGIEYVREILMEMLEACNIEITYQTPSSLIGRETIGQAPISQLITAEVVFDTATSTENETKMTLMIKNEELPLKLDNHCYQMFELVSQMIVDCRHWDLLESIAL